MTKISISKRLLFIIILTLGAVKPVHALAVRGGRSPDFNHPNGVQVLFGEETILAGNDDGSTGVVDIGFPINYFGVARDTLFVNNNGNLTFETGLSTFTPFDLNATQTQIIAPFFADVDTRLNFIDNSGPRTLAVGVVSYGNNTIGIGPDSRNAFTATWNNVGYFAENVDKTNTFQVNVIERSDINPGDFDIEYNYDQVQWETGDFDGGSTGLGGASARVGYSNGTGDAGTFFELPGSGINGAFLDGGPNALVDGSFGSDVPGRYVFEVRNGTPVIPGITQSNPILPSIINAGFPRLGIPPVYQFSNATSGLWFDPPDTTGFDYESSNSDFTAVGLPVGFGDLDIFYGVDFTTLLGTFEGGSMIDFEALLGAGLASFRVEGIDPLVDSSDPVAFPTQLFFSQETGNNFTMTPLLVIPEPASIAMVLIGLGLHFAAIAGKGATLPR